MEIGTYISRGTLDFAHQY